MYLTDIVLNRKGNTVKTIVDIRMINNSDNPSPSYQTEGSSGMDLHAYLEDGPIIIKPGQIIPINTGIHIEIPEGFEGQVRSRSGLSTKHGIAIVNGVGTIDSDYTGNISMPVINLSKESFVIDNGMRIAQLVICPVARANIILTDRITQTDRGTGGFGSTGI